MSNTSSNKTIEIDPKHEEELQAPPSDDKVEKISKSRLKDEARKRAAKRPMLQKIARAFKQNDEIYRELIINSEPLERRVALLVDGTLEKFEIERRDESRNVGAIFKGKIQNLEAGLKAAFVDINQPKNAFLHYWDIQPGASDSSVEIVRENRTDEQKKRTDKVSIKDIPKMYPVGTDIIVQITKDQIGSKGPRTTTNIAIPGRYLVFMPYSGQCGISRKIEDRAERERLKQILRSLTIPEGMGVIIRTAGEGKKARFFVRDFHILLRKWKEIQEKIDNQKEPGMLYQEPDLIERTVRDFLTEDIERVLVDNEDDYDNMRDIVSIISPRSKGKINLFTDDIPIFERYNIERQIEQTFDRNVPLPGGGEIVIEETEALVAIDVNTGGHKGQKDGKDFILNVNIEAAREAARQIRLRNIGGLIILDFIDMKNKRDRQTILNIMREELDRDRAKSHVLPISQLGIMQMTRQRHSESTSSGIYIPCRYSNGRGLVKSPRTMSVEIQRRLISILKHTRRNKQDDKTLNLLVLLHPDNLGRIKDQDYEYFLDIEKHFNTKLSFRADISYHVENFKVLDMDGGYEMR